MTLDSLSHLLLKNILEYLDNFDRIIFSLINKKLYYEKSRYISFSTKRIPRLSYYEYSSDRTNYSFKSYLDIFKQSIEKRTTTLYITSNYELSLLKCNINQIAKYYSYKYDFILNKDSDDFNEKFKLNQSKHTYIGVYNKTPISEQTQMLQLTLKSDDSLPISLLQPNNNAFSNLTTFLLTGDYNQPIEPFSLPSSLTYISITGKYNQPLKKDSIPDSVIYLEFCNSNTRVKSNFNQYLEPNVLPSSITYLHLSQSFNQPLEIGSLPPKLERLMFGYQFDQPIGQHILPTTLRELWLGVEFNQRLEPGSLPYGLEILNFVDVKFGDQSFYNQPIGCGCIPPTVHTINFGNTFNQVLVPSVIPKSIKIMNFGSSFNQPLTKDVLHEGLEKLRLDIGFDHIIPLDVYPTSLKSLNIHHIKLKICTYPKCLTEMELYSNRNSDLIPTSVTKLTTWFMDNPILPSHITHLTLTVFNKPLIGILDHLTNLTTLSMTSYNSLLWEPGIFPESLTSISMPLFNCAIEPDIFPSKLRYLYFGCRYFDIDHLPKSLFHLRLSNISLNLHIKFLSEQNVLLLDKNLVSSGFLTRHQLRLLLEKKSVDDNEDEI